MPASFLPARKARKWLPKAEIFSKNDALIIVVVTAITMVFSLAEAIAAGVAVALIGFSFKSGNTLTPYISIDNKDGQLTKTVTIVGPLFFGTVDFFRRCFDPATDPDIVELNFAPNTVFDSSATEAILANTFALGIPFVTLLCALAMISRLRYAHFVNRYLAPKQDFTWLAKIIIPLVFASLWPQITLAVGFTAYALTGPLTLVRKKRSLATRFESNS